MQIDPNLLRELRYFRWAALLAALSVAVLAILAAAVAVQSVWPSSAILPVPLTDPPSNSSCATEGFYRAASSLKEQGEYKQLLTLSDERIKLCRGDRFGWWFKAQALALDKQWDPALDALAQAELLSPEWRRPYILPLRESIEWNKAQKK